MAQASVQPESAVARKRTRSPAYPYVNLETAIARAKQFYEREQRNAANISIAAKHWGFVDSSSSGAQTVAALMSFGLMQDEGTGEKRAVRLTQAALRILLDSRPDSTERAELIRQAALAPKIHKQLWDKWGVDLPSDAQLKHTLLFDWETPFNENAVDYFIGEYRSTIAFAKLTESDKVRTTEGESDGKPVVTVGNYVQWVSQGAEQFHQPKKVTHLSEDGKYAFVEGEKTGIPIEELEIGEAPKNTLPPPAGNRAIRRHQQEAARDMRQDVFSLDNGGEVVISWPVPLTQEMVTDIKDWLKIVERKITRSIGAPENATNSPE